MKSLMVGLLFGFALIVGGCQSSDVLIHTPDEIKQMDVKSAVQAVIDNTNLMIISAIRTTGAYYESGAFTQADAQRYTNQIEDLYIRNGQVQDLLDAGLVIDAKDQAEVVRTAVELIMKELIEIRGEQ